MAKSSDRNAQLERIKNRIERKIARLQDRAVDKVAALTDETRLWNERTIGDVANLKLVEAAQAEIKAKKGATTVTAHLGVVVLPARIEDKGAWEEQARVVEAEIRDRNAIEAIPVEKKD